MKNILCFGDSNTFGHNPENSSRYDLDERWTSLLQKILGNEYKIIEEGLCGRTTTIDDNLYPFRNGKSMLYGCLHTHKPLDLVILCLGTNDLKRRFNLTAKDISKGVNQLINIIKNIDFEDIFKPLPKILLMCPIRIDRDIEKIPDASFDLKSVENSEKLPFYYEKVAKENNCYFFDAGAVAKASKIDCVHLDRENHKKLAEKLVIEIKNILPD